MSAVEPSPIALVLLAGDGGRVGVVEAGPPRGDKRSEAVDPALQDLLDCGLYSAGRVARAAARRLAALSMAKGRLLRPAPVDTVLTPAVDKEFDGLDEANSASAELGLALAILMRQHRCRRQVVAATGALSEGGPSDADFAAIPIKAVAGVDEKLAALGRFLEEHRGGPWSDGLVLATPALSMDGRPFLEAHAGAVASLEAAAKAVGSSVVVAPARSLNEAVKRLGPRPASHPKEWLARLGLGFGVLCGAMALTVAIWLSQPTDLRFGALKGPGGAEATTPLRTAYNHLDGDGAALPECRGRDGVLRVGWGEELTVLAEIGPTTAPAQAYEGIIVGVTEDGDAKLYPAALLPPEGRLARGGDGVVRFGGRIPITPPPRGDGDRQLKLFVLARKLRRYDYKQIEAELRDAMAAAPKDGRLNAASRVIADVSGASLEAVIVATPRVEGCVMVR
ncbi:MAG: hypothetical protein MRY74_16485 [Neomegalonema sp.]|nr:hypothetical protein [Neomegalonema sp.]